MLPFSSNGRSVSPPMESKHYTMYMKDGKRDVIKGVTFESAFYYAGYPALDNGRISWHTEGVDDTHYWDAKAQSWVKREALRIHAKDFMNNTYQDLVAWFDKHHFLVIDFDNGDVLSLEMVIGLFRPYGCVKHIVLSFGEYCEGSYSGHPDDKEKHHYMACNLQYFAPSNNIDAVVSLAARFSSDPSKIIESPAWLGIKEIAEKQTSL